MAELAEDGVISVVSVPPALWLSTLFGGGVTPVFPDITLRVGTLDWSMQAHRGVLASSIPYFQRALTEGWAEFESGEVTFSEREVCPDGLLAVIGTSYGQEIHLTTGNVCTVHRTANFLGLEADIAGKCVMFMLKNLKVENVTGFWLYAQHQFPGAGNLVVETEKFISVRFGDISEQSHFLNLKWDQLLSFCSAADKFDWRRASENVRLDAYLKWLNFDWPKRCVRVSEIIELIVFSDVDFGMINDLESVDQIRNRVCDTDAERIAEGQLSKMLLHSSKRRRIDDFTNQVVQPCGYSLSEISEDAKHIVHIAYYCHDASVRQKVTAHFGLKSNGWVQHRRSNQPRINIGTGPVMLGRFKTSDKNFRTVYLCWYSDKWILSAASSVLTFVRRNVDLILPPQLKHADVNLSAYLSQKTKVCFLVSSKTGKAKHVLVFSLNTLLDENVSMHEVNIPLLYSLNIEHLIVEKGLEACAMGAVGSHMVLLGGRSVRSGEGNDTSQPNRRVWMLDLNTYTPKEGPVFPYAAENPIVCSNGDYLFVTGGACDGTSLASAFYHMLGTTFWTRLPPMRGPREGHSLLVCGDRLVALGGRSQGCAVKFGEELRLKNLADGWQEVDVFKNLKSGFACLM